MSVFGISPESLRLRVGTFVLTDESMNRAIAGDAWNAISQVMRVCLVLVAEYNAHAKLTTYRAICPMFDEVPHGEPAPLYAWIFEEDEDFPGRPFARAVRLEV